jgi:hypothetical protein
MIFVLLFSFLWPVIPCVAQDAASAKAFMNSAFKLYQNHGDGIYGKHGNDRELMKRFIHSSLLALIDKDIKTVAAAGTDIIPYAGGGDLICDCQEWDGIWVSHMDVNVENPQRAQVIVSFALYEPKNCPKDDLRVLKYTLVPEHGQWRIYDITDMNPSPDASEAKSMREGLQKEIASYANPPKP